MPTKFIASASAFVVLPSPGTEEVSMITCGGASTLDSSTEVRRLRTASIAAEEGFAAR